MQERRFVDHLTKENISEFKEALSLLTRMGMVILNPRILLLLTLEICFCSGFYLTPSWFCKYFFVFKMPYTYPYKEVVIDGHSPFLGFTLPHSGKVNHESFYNFDINLINTIDCRKLIFGVLSASVLIYRCKIPLLLFM